MCHPKTPVLTTCWWDTRTMQSHLFFYTADGSVLTNLPFAEPQKLLTPHFYRNNLLASYITSARGYSVAIIDVISKAIVMEKSIASKIMDMYFSKNGNHLIRSRYNIF